MHATRNSVAHLARQIVGAVICCGLALSAAKAQTVAAPSESAFETNAETALRAMSEYLRSKPLLTVTCERVSEGVTYDDEKIQTVSRLAVHIERPAKFKAQLEQAGNTVLWCGVEGRVSGSCQPGNRGAVATGLEPPGIAGMVDALAARHGISLALADLFVADPMASLKEGAVSGRHVGRETVAGVLCDHLAYRAERLDWQLWIEVGQTPLVRRFVITYRDQPMAPQLSFSNLNWTFPDRLPDGTFSTDLPDGATRMDMQGFVDFLRNPVLP